MSSSDSGDDGTVDNPHVMFDGHALQQLHVSVPSFKVRAYSEPGRAPRVGSVALR